MSRCLVDRGTLDGLVGKDGTANRMGNRYPVNQQKTATTNTPIKMTEKMDDMVEFPLRFIY